MEKALKVSGVGVLVILVAGLLSGCEEEVKSVDWWKEHPAELKEKIFECKETGEDTNNCRNAKGAAFRLRQQNAPIPTFK